MISNNKIKNIFLFDTSKTKNLFSDKRNLSTNCRQGWIVEKKDDII